ncbi:hypothetical protein BLNAU_12651 [Blattamonas nauphoetae]|uniref:PH domain-containing protein n=1 Tax=Blattamonas nauphoetae TaxID=2049346 RepID=A0ABQ9XNL3_9EUKA|nr:hypothetical protein BLNAU_12651 [Blattamonas nauphoetae]
MNEARTIFTSWLSQRHIAYEPTPPLKQNSEPSKQLSVPHLNKLLAESGDQKNITLFLNTLGQLLMSSTTLTPTESTLTAVINGLDRFEESLFGISLGISLSHQFHIPLNEVHATCIIKSLLHNSLISEAYFVISQFVPVLKFPTQTKSLALPLESVQWTKQTSPNSRILDTFFRGCLRAGSETSTVTHILETIQPKIDAHTHLFTSSLALYDEAITCYVQNLEVDKGWELCTKLKQSLAASDPIVFLTNQKATQHIGDSSKWGKIFQQLSLGSCLFVAKSRIEKNVQNQEKIQSTLTRADKGAKIALQYVSIPDKVGSMKKKGSSHTYFTTSQKREVQEWCTKIRKFLAIFSTLSKHPPLHHNHSATRNVLTIPFGTHSPMSILSSAQPQPLAKLKRKSSSDSSERSLINTSPLFPVVKSGTNLLTLFSNPYAPCCLEIGPGNGEWCISQLLTPPTQSLYSFLPPNSNWITTELRYERVFEMWAQGILVDAASEAEAIQKKTNFSSIFDRLIVTHSDATTLLPPDSPTDTQLLIPPHSLDLVIINYPQPPSGFIGKEVSTPENRKNHEQKEWSVKQTPEIRIPTPFWDGHILSGQHLRRMATLLKDDSNAMIVIMTDDANTKVFVEESAKAAGLKTVESTEVPFASTLQGSGSSYFDRLWRTGGKETRFMMKFGRQ